MPPKPSILEFFLQKAPKIAKAAKVVAQVINEAKVQAQATEQKSIPFKKPRPEEGTVVKMAFLTRQDDTSVAEIKKKIDAFYTSEALPFCATYDPEIYSSNVKDSYHVCMFFDVLIKAEKKVALAEMRARATELVEKSSEVLGFWVRS